MRELLNALSRWYDAKTEHDKAYAEYQGYSWDYHGRNFVEKLSSVEKDTAEALDRMIREIVRNEIKGQAMGRSRK